MQQFAAQLVGIVAQLRGREAVAGQGVDVGVDVAELVVEVRAPDALRQVAAMSPTFLRTWYQVCGTCEAGAVSLMVKNSCDWPRANSCAGSPHRASPAACGRCGR
jgi:hypothetical protein